LRLSDDVEVVAVISIFVQHGEVVDDDAKNSGGDRGERTDVSPHLSAIGVGNTEGILQDEDAAADQAADVSESLSNLERTAHDVEGPDDAHPDVKRKVSVPRFEPDRREDEATAFLEVVNESENNTDAEEDENDHFKSDLSSGSAVFTDTEIEDPTASLATI
jgi:hypothetical protein